MGNKFSITHVVRNRWKTEVLRDVEGEVRGRRDARPPADVKERPVVGDL